MMNAYTLMWQTERSFMTDGMTGVQAERLTKAYNEKKKQGNHISKGIGVREIFCQGGR